MARGTRTRGDETAGAVWRCGVAMDGGGLRGGGQHQGLVGAGLEADVDPSELRGVGDLLCSWQDCLFGTFLGATHAGGERVGKV